MSNSIVGALVVLVLLVGVWIFIDTSPYTGESRELSSSFSKFAGVDFKSVGKIALSKGGGKVELEKKDGQWVVASSYGYPADGEKVEKILTSLGELKSGEEAGASAASHEHFEVDGKKGSIVRLSDATGKELGSVTVGKTAPGGGIGVTRVFMRFGEDESTYKVESNLRSDASLYGDSAAGKNYLEKDVLKLDEEMEIQTVRVSRLDKQDLIVERRFREVPVETPAASEGAGEEDEAEKEPETKQEEYYVVTRGTETFDVGSSEEWTARGILNRGKTITIDDAAAPTDLAEYGLDSPHMVVTLEYRKKGDANDALKTVTLAFGNATKDDEGKDDGYFFMLDHEGQKGRVYTVATYKYDGWNKDVKDFLPKEEEKDEDEDSDPGEGPTEASGPAAATPTPAVEAAPEPAEPASAPAEKPAPETSPPGETSSSETPAPEEKPE